MSHVIYLTGAPATGKSTLSRGIKVALPETLVFSYSDVLRTFVAKRLGIQDLTEDDIRRKSAQVVTRVDVNAVDEYLVNFVTENRQSKPILIDSHPVTKEDYGFRVTPFKMDALRSLNPDVILCLYLDSARTAERIGSNPAGRPLPTSSEIEMHSFLQAAVAVQYGLLLDKPMYLLDSGIAKEDLVRIALNRANLPSPT